MTSFGTAGFRSSALEDLRPSQVVFSGWLGRCEKLTSFRGRRRNFSAPIHMRRGAGGGRNELDETLDAYQQHQDNRDQPPTPRARQDPHVARMPDLPGRGVGAGRHSVVESWLLSRVQSAAGNRLMIFNSCPTVRYLRKARRGREPGAPRVVLASASKASHPVCSTRDIRRGCATIDVPRPDCKQRLCSE